jgi:LPS sulfotransferase NodH
MIYAICCTSRTGSSWVGAVLRGTGLLGKPHDYLNYPPGPDESRCDQVARVVAANRTPNGVFGATFLPVAYRTFIACLVPDRHVYLTRSDAVAQAVSAYRAMAGGEWCWYKGSPRLRPDLPYDFAAIAAQASFIAALGRAWEELFRDRGVDPLRVEYGALVADPHREFARLLAHLGVADAGPDLIDRLLAGVPIQVQRNAEDADWAARYREEAAARTPPSGG